MPKPPPPGVSIVRMSPGDIDRKLSTQVVDRARIPTLQRIAAQRAARSPVKPNGAIRSAAFRQHGDDHGRRNSIRRTTPSPPRCRPQPARAAANAKLVDAHRIAPFDDFRIGQPRVRHMGMDSVGSVGFGVAPLPPQIVS